MDIASLGVSINIQLGDLVQQIDQVKKATESMTRSLNAAFKEITNVSGSSRQAIASLAQHMQKAQQAISGTNRTLADSANKIGQTTARAQAHIASLANSTVQSVQVVQQAAQGVNQAIQTNANQSQNAFQKLATSMKDAATSIEAAVNRLEQTIKNLSTQLQALVPSLSGVHQASGKAAAGLVQVQRRQQDAVSGSANLGRFMRVLTTNILGVNAAAIALGTALGNLATQLVSRLIVAVVQSVTQFGRLRNELLETTVGLRNFDDEMKFLTDLSIQTGRSLEDLSQQWLQMAEDVRRAGGDVERVRKSFADWHKNVAEFRGDTVESTMTSLSTAFGRLIRNIDTAIGSSQFFSNAMQVLTWALNKTADAIGDPDKQLNKLTLDLYAAQRAVEAYTERMDEMRKETNFFGRLRHTEAEIQEGLNKLLREEQAIRNKIQAIQQAQFGATAQQEAQLEIIFHTFRRQIEAEYEAAGKHHHERERIARLMEFEIQLKQAGIELDQVTLGLYKEMLNVTMKQTQILNDMYAAGEARRQFEAQRATEIVQARGGLFSDMILTYEQYANAVENAEERIRLAQKNSFMAELEIQKFRIESQKNYQNALLDTAQMVGQTLTALFGRSKAAAIAEAIINTAVGVTRALRDVPFPLNWVQAGLIAAQGAAQIATIRSTNAGGGGSTRGVSGGGQRTAPAATTAPPARALQIIIPKGDIWSSERVTELIERINEEVSNGKTLISTRTKPI